MRNRAVIMASDWSRPAIAWSTVARSSPKFVARSQVVRDVVAYTGNLNNKGFNLAQHPVDADGELVERVIAPAGRQALAQVACHDAQDSPVDIRETTDNPAGQ